MLRGPSSTPADVPHVLAVLAAASEPLVNSSVSSRPSTSPVSQSPSLPPELVALGYDSSLADALALRSQELQAPLVAARVIAQDGERVRLGGIGSTFGEPSGRLRYHAAPLELPLIGDWVACSEEPGGLAVIHALLPRRTLLVRRAAGRRGERQAVAANVEVTFVVTSANRDANPRRVERYLSAIWDSGSRPVLVLNKIDACEPERVAELVCALEACAPGVAVVPVSAWTGDGLERLDALTRVDPSRVSTVAFVGMSGVGKSSLVNNLLGHEEQLTLPIDQDDRGRHTTTRRQLFALPSGTLVIDTPGMRLFGLVEDEGGLETEFSDIATLARACRFTDCTHHGEPGCAVRAAVTEGALEPARLAARDKLAREIETARTRRQPGAAQNQKRRWKEIHRAQRARKKVDPKLRD